MDWFIEDVQWHSANAGHCCQEPSDLLEQFQGLAVAAVVPWGEGLTRVPLLCDGSYVCQVHAQARYDAGNEKGNFSWASWLHIGVCICIVRRHFCALPVPGGATRAS